MTAVDPDRLDESQLEDFRRELAGMSDAALARTYETYRTECGLRANGIPRMATMQRFWQTWEECRRRRLEQVGMKFASQPEYLNRPPRQ